jgi:hypothetical protein
MRPEGLALLLRVGPLACFDVGFAGPLRRKVARVVHALHKVWPEGNIGSVADGLPEGADQWRARLDRAGRRHGTGHVCLWANIDEPDPNVVCHHVAFRPDLPDFDATSEAEVLQTAWVR